MSTTLEAELQRLRKSEAHYRTLLDESADPTFSFYADGTYRYVNRAFAKGAGKAVDDIIGHQIWDVFTKEEADKRFAVVKKVFSTGTKLELEVRVPLPTGNTYYLTTAKPVKNEQGNVESVICTSKNITKRKLAEIALENEHKNLMKAFDEIKTLSGLLPICACCKKIRDDNGYWNDLETYLSTHTDAKVSHGICMPCLQKTQPEIYARMEKKGLLKEFQKTALPPLGGGGRNQT